jgi:peptidyl-dipeptidase A
MQTSPRILPALLILSALAWPAGALAQGDAASNAPSAADAQVFLRDAEARLDRLGTDAQRAQWVADNFITDDTEILTAQAAEKLLQASGELAPQARRYTGLALDAASARKLKLLQLSLRFADDADRESYTRLEAAMEGAYGKAKYCPKGGGAAGAKDACLALGDLEKILAQSRDPAQLKDVWLGWHEQSRAYRDKYAQYVALSNKGAREMGYADTGAFWRSMYDMPPDEFAQEMERTWSQVEPLYRSLLTYARFKLRQQYGAAVVPASGPIPAHLFGNMWSQSWENIYPILKPESVRPSYDLDKILDERKVSAQDMTRYAERFYQSLGMEKLPDTFWSRSLFTKPRDREVVCHASAWDIDQQEDVRIKMCIRPTAEDFTTIHHELGHVYYYLAYRDKSVLFRNGANDGFHEAIGDTVALSVTPSYLERVGLLAPGAGVQDDIDMLLRRALEKVAFLPFGFLVDKWRWQVYAGHAGPEEYDRLWWELRERYQGIGRPAPSSVGGFDAGAKYHVASDTPYARYFLADLLQFQFHRALCRAAGYSGPLHRCSIFQSKAAGERFRAMLALGASRPWPEALQAMTGEERMDGSAILEYFAPLKTWLDEQNRRLAAADPAVAAELAAR